ncbi:molecular chaperone [Klebsiella sp. BIGb0407]|uniref:fimbrial biogenesis chaperone n=1 Tax=Klebsiella sp. BIGb0407 TaxID=2940603 RepID=UPI002168524F|nr:molecular chaperone [Klebsiella sp. BIGb0407]MCS3429514.1 P pilus assembly chaperone PapD [Klebsiella sp. BIGb0407]
MRFIKKNILALFGTTILNSIPAMAGISLDGTRIIFRAEDDKIGASIQVRSALSSESPYLVKTQITRDTSGQQTAVPFITAPSLFRLEPGNANQVRILVTPHSLPQDRESVFYFRATALPASRTTEQSDKYKLGGELQLASGNVIKLFYRPKGLTESPEKSASALGFSSSVQGVKVANPGPYYLTLSSLQVNGKAVNIKTSPGSNMIAPFSDYVFPYQKTTGAVQWQTINDYGGLDTFHGKIQ